MKTPGPPSDSHKRRWKFGQNFLIDGTVISQIVDDVPCGPKDWVLEIGPGQGALTKGLMKKCERLTAIEIDPKWVEHLRGKDQSGNLEVVQADAAKIDLEELLKGRPKPVVVGNLPYNRAAPILFHFLPHIRRFHSMNIMVQYEVAKRIAANPHSRDFGFLSVFIQNYATAVLVRKIPPDAFRPKPKVLSATVRLLPLPEPYIEHPLFLTFVEAAFSQKRKMLTNSLQPRFPKQRILEAMKSAGIPALSRAEDLSVPQFAQLFGLLEAF